jgi:hypothetical protein
MTSRAEIGSIATTLDELTRRIGDLAESASGPDEELATELYGVERALAGAVRRLRKLSDPPRR